MSKRKLRKLLTREARRRQLLENILTAGRQQMVDSILAAERADEHRQVWERATAGLEAELDRLRELLREACEHQRRRNPDTCPCCGGTWANHAWPCWYATASMCAYTTWQPMTELRTRHHLKICHIAHFFWRKFEKSSRSIHGERT